MTHAGRKPVYYVCRILYPMYQRPGYMVLAQHLRGLSNGPFCSITCNFPCSCCFYKGQDTVVANFEMLEGGRKNKKQTASQNRGGDEMIKGQSKHSRPPWKRSLLNTSLGLFPRFVSDTPLNLRLAHLQETIVIRHRIKGLLLQVSPRRHTAVLKIVSRKSPVVDNWPTNDQLDLLCEPAAGLFVCLKPSVM